MKITKKLLYNRCYKKLTTTQTRRAQPCNMSQPTCRIEWFAFVEPTLSSLLGSGSAGLSSASLEGKVSRCPPEARELGAIHRGVVVYPIPPSSPTPSPDPTESGGLKSDPKLHRSSPGGKGPGP